MIGYPTAEDVARAAAALLADYRTGAWMPHPDDRALAEGLARLGPSASSLRTAARHTPPGRLADVLTTAAAHLEAVAADAGDDRLLPLRRLLDALAPEP